MRKVGIGTMLALWLGMVSVRGQDVSIVADLTPAVPYEGWAHMTTDLSQQPPGLDRQGQPLPRTLRYTNHLQAGVGMYATVLEATDGKDIQFYSLPRREAWRYNRKTNEVEVETLTQKGVDEIGFEMRGEISTTVAALLANIDSTHDLKPSITQRPEGKETRVDIVYFATAGEQQAFNREHQTSVPLAVTAWVNEEKLLTRLRTDSGRDTQTSEITYGKPDIQGIAELGMPATAKLVDNRVRDAELIALQTRLWERQKKGFGNYTALLSEYMVNADAKAAATFGSVTLSAIEGEKLLVAHYSLFSGAAGPNSTPAVLNGMPADWPRTDLQQLLPALRAATPSYYRVWDGRAGWYASTNLRNIQPMTVMVLRQVRASGIASDFWSQGQAAFGGTTVTPMTTLVADAAHPNLLGIHRREETSAPNASVTTETTYWYDPARDDLPVEWESETQRVQNGTIYMSRTKRRYTGFAQLPETKQWYATDWSEQGEGSTRDGKMQATVEHRFHLQILPGLKLDNVWFTDPRTRVNAETAPAKNNALP